MNRFFLRYKRIENTVSSGDCMKFFIDTANIDEIRKAWDLGVIDGVTMNPALIAKEKRDPVEILRDICGVVNDWEKVPGR